MSKLKVTIFLVILTLFSFFIVKTVQLSGEVDRLNLVVKSLEKSLDDERQKLSECRQSKEAVDLVCKQTEKSLLDIKQELESRKTSLQDELKQAEEILDEQKPVVQDADSILPDDIIKLLTDSCKRSNQGNPCPSP